MTCIVNRTRPAVLAWQAAVAGSFGPRLRGLMFRDAFPDGVNGLMLTPCRAVHTCFMRFAIDVIFIDKSRQVLACAENVPPRRLIFGPAGTRTVLELPAGTVKGSGTRPRDYLDFIPWQGGTENGT